MVAKYFCRVDQESNNPLHSEIQLDEKTLITPFYGSIIRSDIDAECLRDAANSGQLKNTQVVCYTLPEAQRFKHIMQKSLFQFTGQEINFKPFSDFVLTIDPAGEYLRHNVKSEVDKLLQIPDLPDNIRKILVAEGKERIALLNELMKNEKEISQMVEWYLKKGISYGAKTAVAASIPIKGKATLEFATNVNRLAVTAQEDAKWQKAVYYLFDYAAFKDISIIQTVIDQLYVLTPNIVIFKVYNPKFEVPEAITHRSNLNYLLEQLLIYRQTHNALTFALNVDSIGYHFLAQGLCGIIEPISGNFNPDIRVTKKQDDIDAEERKISTMGRYPDPVKLVEYTYEDLERLETNNGAALPCHCSECSRYDKLPRDGYTYNRLRRKHRVLARDRFIDELNDAATKGTLRASMLDRLSESPKLGMFRTNYS